jgi:mRNA interferase RelE/StbE
MSWSIYYSKDADKFLEKNPNLIKSIRNEIKKFIRKLNGETVSINFKKLHGEWSGFYRIRKGKIRIVITINENEKNIIIFNIDFRGDVYK